MVSEVTDSTLIPFGRYKGKKRMIDVPAPYLLWLFNQGCYHEGVKKYIINNIDALRKEASKIKR